MAAFYTGTYNEVTLAGGAKYYELLTSGTLTLDNTNGYSGGAILQSILLVGGGGGSGNDAGGGGGGVAFAAAINRILAVNSTFTVTIGAGGAVGIFSANRGGDTSAFGYTAVGSPSARFDAANNNGANGSGSCDSTVTSSYGNAPTGQPAIAGFQTWGGNAGGFHGSGRGSGSGGGATQVGGGTQTAGGNGIQVSIGNTNRWYAVGGRSSYAGGGTNNANWSGTANTGNGGTSNTTGYTGIVSIVLIPQTVPVPVNANILVVAGGGSGGGFNGGGAGCAIYASNQTLTSSGTYSISVGAGGAFPNVTSQLDSGGTRVFNVNSVTGNNGSNSSFGSLVVAGGGGAGGGTNNNRNGITGSGVTVPAGATVFSNTGNVNGSRGGNGTGAIGSNFQGGAGSSVTIGVNTYSFGGGGSGCGYWNVSGSTPGGRTAGGVTGGGRSGLIAGNRSDGVQPPAGDPPTPNTNSYSPGTDGTANTGGGGGSAAAAEVVFAVGDWGVLGGAGGSGRVVVSYTNAAALFTGGTVTSSGSGASTVWYHDFTTVGTFNLTAVSGNYSGFGGNGGALGQPGNAGGASSSGQTGGTGGAAGKAINVNGNTLNIVNNGQILGATN